MDEFLADAGYYSSANVEAVTNAGMNPFIATPRLKHHDQIPDSPSGRVPDHLTPEQRTARKLRTKKGPETYRKRKWMVEPPVLN